MSGSDPRERHVRLVERRVGRGPARHVGEVAIGDEILRRRHQRAQVRDPIRCDVADGQVQTPSSMALRAANVSSHSSARSSSGLRWPSAAEVRQRIAVARLGALHLTEEHGVGAARDRIAHPALDARERVAQHGVALAGAPDLEPGELVAVAAGEAHGELALVLAQDVDDERAALADLSFVVRLRQTSSDGGSSDTEETALAVAPWSESAWREVMRSRRREVPDDVAVALPIARRGRHIEALADPMPPRYHQQNGCVYRSV